MQRQEGSTAAPLGVIPKRNRVDKFRLILDLSALEGQSVNDGVRRDYRISVDNIVAEVLKKGKGALPAKMDIKQALSTQAIGTS